MKKKKIHFVGIKGVGMTSLAILAKEAGFDVTGCDIEEEFITDAALAKAGISISTGFSQDHLKDIDLVITTGAHGGFSNNEVIKAKEMGIDVWTQGQAAGEFMKGDVFKREFTGISIAGSHGKTTTSAMIATVLKQNGLDPSFLIGTSQIPSLGLPGHFGKGKYFVCEADEYATEPIFDKTPKFLWQHPKFEVFTNIELDHPDMYGSVEKVREAFESFAGKLGEKGVLVANGDDIQIKQLLGTYKGKKITYGFSKDNDFTLSKVSISGPKTFFWAESKEVSLGEFALNVSGEYNALNALATIAVCLECGLTIEKIKKGLAEFRGSKRRFEYLGKTAHGATVFDDYAHHPTEIKNTLKAFRQSFPKEKILCIFQPHTYSRTKILFDQFKYSFGSADLTLMTEIYPSLREEPDKNFSSSQLVEAINNISNSSLFLSKANDVVEYITRKKYDKNWVIVTMGAGDIYKVGENIISK